MADNATQGIPTRRNSDGSDGEKASLIHLDNSKQYQLLKVLGRKASTLHICNSEKAIQHYYNKMLTYHVRQLLVKPIVRFNLRNFNQRRFQLN